MYEKVINIYSIPFSTKINFYHLALLLQTLNKQRTILKIRDLRQHVMYMRANTN